jgi:hypothetical protein
MQAASWTRLMSFATKKILAKSSLTCTSSSRPPALLAARPSVQGPLPS